MLRIFGSVLCVCELKRMDLGVILIDGFFVGSKEIFFMWLDESCLVNFWFWIMFFMLFGISDFWDGYVCNVGIFWVGCKLIGLIYFIGLGIMCFIFFIVLGISLVVVVDGVVVGIKLMIWCWKKFFRYFVG